MRMRLLDRGELPQVFAGRGEQATPREGTLQPSGTDAGPPVASLVRTNACETIGQWPAADDPNNMPITSDENCISWGGGNIGPFDWQRGAADCSYKIETGRLPPVLGPGSTEAYWQEETQSRAHSQQVMTRLSYFTGGRATVSRQSLFEVSASATELIFKRDDWEHPDQVPVPPDEIRVGDFGVLGNDGRVWSVKPDGATLDATPKTARKFYTFMLGDTKHVLRLSANGHPLAPTRVLADAKFCVGQKINLSSYATPTITDNCRIDAEWFIPGVFINTVETWPWPSPKYYIDWDLTYQQTTPAWWATGGEKHPRCDWDLTFSNGQRAHVMAKGALNIYRPKLANWLAAPSPSMSVYYLGGYRLGVGDGAGGGGVWFSLCVDTSWDGEAGITQVYDDGSTPVNYGNAVLDEDVFYPFHSDGTYGTKHLAGSDALSAKQISLIDAPWEPCSSFLTILSVKFRDHIRFRPDAGNPTDNVFVTLGKVTWEVHATATYDADEGWQLGSGWWISPPALTDSTEWPYWEANH